MNVLFHAFWGDLAIYRMQNNYNSIRKGPRHSEAATYTLSIDSQEIGKIFFTKRDGPEKIYGAWINYTEDCYAEVNVEFDTNGPHSVTFESKEDDVGQVAFGAVALYGPEPFSSPIERLEAEQVQPEDITGTFMLQECNRRTIVHRNLSAEEPDRIGSSVTFRFKNCPKGRYKLRVYYYSKVQKGLYEIFYLIKGSGQYVINGKCCELMPGCLILTRSDENRELQLSKDENNEYVTVEFRLDFLSQIDNNLLLLKPFVARNSEICFYTNTQISYPLKQLLQDIGLHEIRDFVVQRVSFLIKVQQILLEIYLMYLSVNQSKKVNTMPILADQVAQRIHEYLFEDLDIDALAKSFFTSKTNLNYLFQKKYGCSVYSYITQQRLLAARNKIQNGMTAGEACMLCGFKEYSTFYRQYKKYFNLSPKEEKRTDDKHF